MRTISALLLMGMLMVGGAMAQTWDWDATMANASAAYGVAANHSHAGVPAVGFVFSGAGAWANPCFNCTEVGTIRWDNVSQQWVFNESTKAWSFTATDAQGTADTSAWRTAAIIDPEAEVTASTMAIAGFGNAGSGWPGLNGSFKANIVDGNVTLNIEGGSSAGGVVPIMSPFLDNVAVASTSGSASADAQRNAFAGIVDFSFAVVDPYSSESVSIIKVDSISQW